MTGAVLWGRNGFGDAIYYRPFVREALKVYGAVWLETAWPEVFGDLGVRFVKPDTGLYCSIQNIGRHEYEEAPEGAARVSLKFKWMDMRQHGLAGATRKQSRLNPKSAMDLPPCASPIKGRYAVVRPVTSRTDWANPARSPLAIYVAEAARMLSDSIRVVSVADLDSEQIQGEVPMAHQRFHNGELSPLEIMGLIAGAALVVGGPGWIVPASIAAGVPLVGIGGGQGGCNGPEILSPGYAKAAWVLPDRYCRCTSKRHDCSKTITRFRQKFKVARMTAEARR